MSEIPDVSAGDEFEFNIVVNDSEHHHEVEAADVLERGNVTLVTFVGIDLRWHIVRGELFVTDTDDKPIDVERRLGKDIVEQLEE